jgi:thiamine biosynthesis lipoprotein
VKRLAVSGHGVATSGTYERGYHIYNPKTGKTVRDIVSLTVIGPNILEADRFATAAFAMGREGIRFIGSHAFLEGYMIQEDGTAVFTEGFPAFLV